MSDIQDNHCQSDSDLLATQKSNQRQAWLVRRQAMRAKTDRLHHFFFDLFTPDKHRYRHIAGYWPSRHEIDPRPIMTSLHRDGFFCALPVITAPKEALAFRGWQPGAKMEPGHFAIDIPVNPKIIDPDVIIVPLLAFDRQGYRLGYGGGYYDRTLARYRNAWSIGLAYAAQEALSVPQGKYDYPLDAIVTDHGVIIPSKTAIR